MLIISERIQIPESELSESFVRSSGPGGQNVNKVATAVQLRFDALHSPNLTDEVRQRLIRLAGSRATDEGVLVIEARRFRTQEKNREDARERLALLIRKALHKPASRKPTRPGAAARRRRLIRLAGSRATDEGVLVIEARRFRTQEKNREDARERLALLIRKALHKPASRKPTRPGAAARRRRLEDKKMHGELKRSRRTDIHLDE